MNEGDYGFCHASIYDVPTAVGSPLIFGGMSTCTYACMFLCDSVTKVASIARIENRMKIQKKARELREKKKSDKKLSFSSILRGSVRRGRGGDRYSQRRS